MGQLVARSVRYAKPQAQPRLTARCLRFTRKERTFSCRAVLPLKPLKPRDLFVLLPLLLFAVGLFLARCASGPTLQATDFWRDAEHDAVVALEPALNLPDQASTTSFEFEGVVVDHTAYSGTAALRQAGAEYSLTLLQANGRVVSMHYRIGGGRKIPLNYSEIGHIVLWDRPIGTAGAARARSLLITRVKRDPKKGKQLSIVAALDVSAGLPRDRLPRALAAISPTDVLVYQTAHRQADDCYLSVLHQQFLIIADGGVDVQRPRARKFAPGARVKVGDPSLWWDVLLLDNRRTAASNCQDEPALWAWAAVALAETGTAEAGSVEVHPSAPPPEAKAVALPGVPTPTTPSKPTKEQKKAHSEK